MLVMSKQCADAIFNWNSHCLLIINCSLAENRRPSFVFICASVFMFMVRDNPDDAMQVHSTGHQITSWNKPFNVDMLRLFPSLRATRSVVSS